MFRMQLARCSSIFSLTICGVVGVNSSAVQAQSSVPWMDPPLVQAQAAQTSDAGKEKIARERASQLIRAMTLEQKMKQLTGEEAGVLPELPQCYGARHVAGIAALGVPIFRISNGPVGVGQNDCVDARAFGPDRKPDASPYSHPSSARATALPSAIGVAASFDPSVAAAFGDIIADEMNGLALHVFEAPGINLTRLSIAGRNFEYFGEDPYLSGSMAVAETKAVQSHGIIAMAKHFVANEQETNRGSIHENVDDQVLRELYLLPFEMAVKDGHIASIMCSYNTINGYQACENKPLLTGVLRDDWGFTGYVQSDFAAMKTTVESLTGGLDHEMPAPRHWSPDKLKAALANGSITVHQIDRALVRRYTQMFKAGIADRPLKQTSVNFAANGQKARALGIRSAVLLQNNGALPLAREAKTIVLVGKATQVYAQQAMAGGAIFGRYMGAGGGSSDVVPHYEVSPLAGIKNALRDLKKDPAAVKLILIDDANSQATIDGAATSMSEALSRIAEADAVVVMAGTNAEEGADRASFKSDDGQVLAAPASAGSSLDWYVDAPGKIATDKPGSNLAKSSQTNEMIRQILATHSKTSREMATKTVLVLKDNASISVDRAIVGKAGPSILEVWFPGQEDGNIVADLLFGKGAPSGRLPVTYPFAGNGFLDSIKPLQYPGVPSSDSKTMTVEYSERLKIGYRWYDANTDGKCATVSGSNPCVAFPFGFGLTYTTFTQSKAMVAHDKIADTYTVTASIRNAGKVAGTYVAQVYVSLPDSANRGGATQPPKRLVGFQSVALQPGAERQIMITIDPSASNHPLGVWNESIKKWIIPGGAYRIGIGNSSSPHDIVSAGTITR